MIRYLLDEHVPHAIAHGLRIRGVEVTTAADAMLQSIDDALIVAHALQERLVIFTQDDDFLRLHARGVLHAGIVYSKQGNRSLGELIRYLKLLSDCLDIDEMVGRVEYL